MNIFPGAASLKGINRARQYRGLGAVRVQAPEAPAPVRFLDPEWPLRRTSEDRSAPWPRAEIGQLRSLGDRNTLPNTGSLDYPVGLASFEFWSHGGAALREMTR